MKIELPIFVQTGTADVPKGVSSVRPLFFERPVETNREIAKARAKLATGLTKMLGEMARGGKHREVARYTFCPDLRLHTLKFRLDLRRQSFHGRFPVVAFRQMSRRLAFSPLLPDLWFEVHRGNGLESRAREVYTEYLRNIERNDEEDLQYYVGRFTPQGKTWIDYLEIDISTKQKREKKGDSLFALLGGEERVDGATELQRVGTCLDHLYPEQLQRFSGSEDQLEEIERFFGGRKRQAVMVVGPSLVGKTTLIHEFVFRRVARRQSPFEQNANVWHLAPQRLISGMMYLGQWENRLLAILKQARRRDHVLFFDDILGLYHAGQSSGSDLSVADVLKPYVERGDVRVMAEVTPDALRVFRERDRGFADLFHITRLEEPPDETLIPLLLKLNRSLELRQQCRFDIDVLPTVLELTRRYQPDQSYPGKAAVLLERLAVAHKQSEINRDSVLEEFHRQSGLDIRFLDRNVRLSREEIAEALGEQIVGQREAVDAMADVVSVAKARLNDSSKPLASMLFLGPTGVGKTECAKALARYLFGDEDRLLRFDMNEFLSADAVAQLVGSFRRPEGLLTSAVRERPASVVLLDEIEKAHANVFDLLLQILGEARLTDALGRTVDFSNTIVLLTSNLGTGQSSIASGFGGEQWDGRDTLLRSVRDFFRPEFFNRLDRIIPFAHLGRTELAHIAERTLSQVLAREGFQRRQSALDISPDALAWVVDQGYHPELGARAMKRAVEDHVVHPLAEQLTEIPKELPTVISLARRGKRLEAEVTALDEAEPLPNRQRSEDFTDPKETLGRVLHVLDCIEQQCAAHKPAQGLSAGELSSNTYWYLGVSGYLAELRGYARWLIRKTQEKQASEVVPAIPSQQPKDNTARLTGHRYAGVRRILKEMVAAQDIHDYLAVLRREARRDAFPADNLSGRLQAILRSLAVLNAFRPTEEGWPNEYALVIVRGLPDAWRERACLAADLFHSHEFNVRMSPDYEQWSDDPNHCHSYGLVAAHWGSRTGELEGTKFWREKLLAEAVESHDLITDQIEVLSFEGPRALEITSTHEGTYLFTNEEGRLKPVQVLVLPAMSDADYIRTLAECLDRGKRPNVTVDSDMKTREDDCFAWQPVVAVYAWNRGAAGHGYQRVIDFRRNLRAATNGGDSLGRCVSNISLPAPGTGGLTTMATVGIPVLIWEDHHGQYTACTLEWGYRGLKAAYDETRSGALQQLKRYFEWEVKTNNVEPETDFLNPELFHVRVRVRPEYRESTQNRRYPCESTIELRVPCVRGTTQGEVLCCSMPTLGIGFFCHEPSALQTMVAERVRQELAGRTPQELSRLMAPKSLELDQVLVRARIRRRGGDRLEHQLTALPPIADPMADAGFRKSYSPRLSTRG